MSRLEELYRMREFIDAEILREQALLAAGTSGHMVAAAAKLYGTTVEDVLSESRDTSATKARQAICWLLRQRGLSLPQIGRVVDRDHTTVLYACREIDKSAARQAMLRPLLNRVEGRLMANRQAGLGIPVDGGTTSWATRETIGAQVKTAPGGALTPESQGLAAATEERD